MTDSEEVGRHYFKFGVQLLDDETGRVVEAIETEMVKVPNDITRKILIQWLAGKGRDVTWEVLSDVLESINLAIIASDIRSTFVIK